MRHGPSTGPRGPNDGSDAPPTGDLWPYLVTRARSTIPVMPQLDLATVLVLAGFGVAVALAVLAGRLSARVFSDASRDGEDEG